MREFESLLLRQIKSDILSGFIFLFNYIFNKTRTLSSMCDGLPLGRGARTYNRILRSKDKAKPCRVSPSAPIKPEFLLQVAIICFLWYNNVIVKKVRVDNDF